MASTKRGSAIDACGAFARIGVYAAFLVGIVGCGTTANREPTRHESQPVTSEGGTEGGDDAGTTPDATMDAQDQAEASTADATIDAQDQADASTADATIDAQD